MTDKAGEFDSLYRVFLKHFYDRIDRVRAAPVAARLASLLTEWPVLAASIRGEEVRSLLAQFHGKMDEAIQSREAEIRKILELHSRTANTPGWAYVSRQYGHADVGDRLDLLAILYDERGETDRSIAVLRESKDYCEANGVPFDAADLLEELELSRSAASEPSNGSHDALDAAIRRAYRKFDAAADEIVVVDPLAREFTRAVNQLLAKGRPASVQDVKRRLLMLRRRGSAKGGLPRRSPGRPARAS